MLREDPAYAEKAARIAALARDVTEVIETLGLQPAVAPRSPATGRRVAYHSACSMQHGQRIHAGPKALLAAAGFEPLDVPEGHLCCGSAGTYNLLQPEIAGKSARAQARQYRPDPARSRRHRQYRLHHPARPRLRRAGRAYGRAARLGHRRADAAGSRRRLARASAGRWRDQQRHGERGQADQGRRQPSGSAEHQPAPRRRRNRHRRSSSATGRAASRTRSPRAATASVPARN